ncbi:hypothetical protein VNO77_26890 [Canavalia gladiata]|uniref:Uncharacterized protein n=1 Tax=Canavalia gladiata TaxID=3824 RepID=A0AAN9QA12_CANGL
MHQGQVYARRIRASLPREEASSATASASQWCSKRGGVPSPGRPGRKTDVGEPGAPDLWCDVEQGQSPRIGTSLDVFLLHGDITVPHGVARFNTRPRMLLGLNSRLLYLPRQDMHVPWNGIPVAVECYGDVLLGFKRATFKRRGKTSLR